MSNVDQYGGLRLGDTPAGSQPKITRRQFAVSGALGGLPHLSRAEAERRNLALLVGVSEYPGLDQTLHLAGPKNDIPLIRSRLVERGFAPTNVKVLADDVPGSAGMPTRDVILSALDVLVAMSQPSDLIFLYFAGHGSQMPAKMGTSAGRAENDALHEIFLPRDIGRWNRNVGAIERAITDFELVSRLDAFLAKGAFVWAVFDACHSATLMRGVDEAVRYRHVDPALLGVPRERVASTKRVADFPATRPSVVSSTGGFVAFYAAQTTQTTPELRLPAGSMDRQVHGLFGYTLAEALSSVEGVSYRQLSQFILQRYQAQNLMSPTPLFTGTHLDAPVLGTSIGPTIRQWPLLVRQGRLGIAAGLLAQVEEGAILAVYPHAKSPSGDELARLSVKRAELMHSSLEVAGAAQGTVAESTKWPESSIVRMVQPAAPNFRLRVQRQVTAPSREVGGADWRKATSAIAAHRSRPSAGVQIVWVDRADAYDLRLHVEDKQLWLLPPSAQFYADGPHRNYSLHIASDGFTAALESCLQHVGRAQNLIRIASVLGSLTSSSLLQFDGTLRSADGARRPVDLRGMPQLLENDELTLTVHNPSSSAVDVTALYIDTAWGVTAMHPPPGNSNRVEGGGRFEIVMRFNVQTTGIERLMLIGVAARTQGELHDYSFLAQPSLTRIRSGGTDLRKLLEEAGFGPDPRDSVRGPAALPMTDLADIRVLSFKVG